MWIYRHSNTWNEKAHCNECGQSLMGFFRGQRLYVSPVRVYILHGMLVAAIGLILPTM